MFVLENGADGAQTHSYDTYFLGKLGTYSLEYLLVQFPVLAVSIPRTCALCAVHKSVASAVLDMLLNACSMHAWTALQRWCKVAQ